MYIVQFQMTAPKRTLEYSIHVQSVIEYSVIYIVHFQYDRTCRGLRSARVLSIHVH